MVLLQETIKAKFEEVDIRHFWPNDDFDFYWSAANGHLGGLLSVWDKSKFEMERVSTFERFSHERKGCMSRDSGSIEFNNFIEKRELQEVKLVRKKFTWFRPVRKRCMLDRFLVSESWFQDQPELVAQALKRSVSDHVPILLSTMVKDLVLIPLKVFNSWLQLDECSRTIIDSTYGLNVVNLDLPEKLKEVKSALKG
ncbi:hypothetical protein V6N11_041897 [Hibiscus sabdariffa]|uniref:Uncharacterized protein n=2 Tax=Hibiscus sabdariffa TaxID=183260 RepID=A0ABR2AAK7_9ROSI